MNNYPYMYCYNPFQFLLILLYMLLNNRPYILLYMLKSSHLSRNLHNLNRSFRRNFLRNCLNRY